MIKILLADDHRLLSEGLRQLLEKHKDIEVAGIATDGMEAVEMALKLEPTIVLMDVSMPKLNGIEAVRRILAEKPKIKVIMLSMHLDRRYITEALKTGAQGYVLKDAEFQDVAEAISTVMSGEIYLSQKIREIVIHDYVQKIKEAENSPFSELSAREREVLQLLTEGKTTKEIAGLLFVSVKTVESHRKQIMDKLKIHSIAELTKYAIRHGITQLD